MEEDPVFQHGVKPLTTPEARAVAFRQTRRLVEYDFRGANSHNEMLETHWLLAATRMYDLSMNGKYLLSKHVSEFKKRKYSPD